MQIIQGSPWTLYVANLNIKLSSKQELALGQEKTVSTPDRKYIATLQYSK